MEGRPASFHVAAVVAAGNRGTEWRARGGVRKDADVNTPSYLSLPSPLNTPLSPVSLYAPSSRASPVVEGITISPAADLQQSAPRRHPRPGGSG